MSTAFASESMVTVIKMMELVAGLAAAAAAAGSLHCHYSSPNRELSMLSWPGRSLHPFPMLLLMLMLLLLVQAHGLWRLYLHAVLLHIKPG